ncbi:MAG: hypothetical protein Q4C85_07615 [Actinomyces sp.]|uniref:hypothetical protein n=1 Tax=Actinomyces sp. TaxID=29317 RepID=UPI0026DD998E|nr:hypothetical protein [Actinomyces sp.]MDO4243610.1 hypothetical protein [Actinomyces sp.]
MDDLAFYVVAAATDGWAVLARDDSGNEHLYAYEPAGGEPIDDYAPNWSFSENQSVAYTPRPRTLAEFKALWVDSDTSTILALGTTDSEGCYQSIEVLGASTIEMPQLNTANGSCLQTTDFSTDPKVMTVGTSDPTTLRSFNLMYDTTSGEQITFEGLDPAAGAVFLLVGTTSAVGYDPTTGRLIGYRPA